MPDTVTVASNAHTAMRIHKAPENTEKPGLEPPRETFTLNGNRHPSAVNGLGLTHGVDAEVFRDWMKNHPEHEGVLREMSENDLKQHMDAASQFGFEPGLEKLAADAGNAAKASEGSELEDRSAPVKDADMAATSSVPNDDSPRSQTSTTESTSEQRAARARGERSKS